MPVIKKKQAVFDVAIEEKHGVSLTTPKSRRKDKSKTEEVEATDEDGGEKMMAVDANGKYINLQPAYAKLINAAILCDK